MLLKRGLTNNATNIKKKIINYIYIYMYVYIYKR